MAELAVTIASEMLESSFVQELALHAGITDDVRSMIYEFKSMLVRLKDADRRSEMDKEVKEWVTQLRHVAFEVKDRIEEYVFQHHKESPVQEHGTCRSIRRIKKFFNLPLMRCGRRSLGARIQNIKVQIENISERKERYSFAVTQDTTLVATVIRERDAVFWDEAQMVGIYVPKEKLIRWLVEEQDPKLGVVSVFGMDGVGKTTLVKNVQENRKVRSHFDILGGVTVSQNNQVKRLLGDLILAILEEEDEELFALLMNMEALQLKEKLISILRSKRYFIVIDNIWNLATWEGIKSAFPDTKCGSRIIMTTGSKDIATASVENSGYAYELKQLSQEDSWALFCKVAFRLNGATNEFVDKHLGEVILKFLVKCGGIPLAIVSIAGLLSTKETTEWDTIYSLFHNDSDLRTIIALSYNDLPCHLKNCLLYLCLFPEDSVIKCSKLLRLWAAEGFIIPSVDADLTKEDAAKRCLDELIARGHIQVQDIDLWGRARTCRIHSLFHKFILKMAACQDFAEFSPDKEPDNHRIRRLSISTGKADENIFPNNTRLLFQIQSFFAYGKSSLFNSSNISKFRSGGVKLIKVLDLEGVHLKEFPGEVLINMYFLRYLGINTEKFSLPSSLGRLIKLETLVLKCPLLFQLPSEILQLQHLRNLLGDLLELPKGIGGMITLEKLNLVVGYDGIDRELGMLTRLRSLCMVCVIKEHKIFALSSLQKMAHLRSLYLRLSKPKENVLDVQNLRHFPPRLQSLTLIGAMNDIPRQIFSLENLTQLKLSYSGVRGSALFKGLQLLRKLVKLVLEMDAIDDANLHFGSESFLKLITLELHGLNNLRSIGFEEGAMPCIQNIRFINCPLEHVPVGIEHLPTLRQIGLANMASHLEGAMKILYWRGAYSPTVKSFADEFDMDSSTVRSFVNELDTAD